MLRRYGPARCCTEARMKAGLWNSLAAGYTPAGAFEIPRAEEIKKDAADKVKRAEELRAMREEAARIRECFETGDTTGSDQAGDLGKENIVINHKSWVIHRPHATDAQRTACPYPRRCRPLRAD